MGKQGPCYHCGVTSTPLWRNGPPEKPVLCNACGSRWRTKGTLANYTPLHARMEPDDEERRVCRMKSISINKKKDAKVLKRKQNYVYGVVGGDVPDDNQGYLKVFDEDTSNRSSSGSAISNSESCAQFSSADASELTGPAQSVVWDTVVPSKKRTCVNRPKPTSIEKLTKDLYTILHEQQSSCISELTEEDILIEIETPMASVEMGHGSVLIRHAGSLVRDEESEASSLSVDNQYYLSEAYSHSAILGGHKVDKGMKLPSPTSDDGKNYGGRGMQGKLPKRDKLVLESLEMLGCHDSALRHVDLQDIVNFEEFVRNLTDEEQGQLFTYLPDVDTANLSESLETMFDSPQFKENLSSFQQLLAEGVFDISLWGVKKEDCQTLKRLALLNLTKSSWVERYCSLKKRRCITRGSHVGKAPNFTAASSLVNFKRSRDPQNQKVSEATTTTKSSKRVMIDAVDCEGSCFSPRTLFALPTDGKDSVPFIEEGSDQDLLLEVPSNGSFLQAELLPSNYRF